jgi:2-keto-3-deoxy-L-rhamnonate aldolase RhmA
MKSKFFQRLDSDESPIGSIIIANGADWVETVCDAGVDYVCIDFMITSIDWAGAAEMIRAAGRYNVTPWIRLQAYPWGSGTPVNLSADVLRALSIGAEVVVASVNSAEEVRMMLAPGSDQHRRPYVEVKFNDASKATTDLDPNVAAQTLIMPLLESREAIENVGEIVQVDGLKGVFLGMGDLAREYGTPGNDRSPAVREMVKHVVEVASAAGVDVFTSMPPRWDIDDVTEGARWYAENGAKAVWLPYPTYVVHQYYTRAVQSVRKALS